MENVVILGATSAVAQAVAKHYARASTQLILVGRNQAYLESIEQDLMTRGAEKVQTIVQDLAESSKWEDLVAHIYTLLDRVDILLVAHGTLPDQALCEQSAERTLEAINANALSQIAMLTAFGNKMAASRSGKIAVISSVAGDRGRQSNYVYGAAKAMLSTYVDGLRNRLYKSGVSVLTVKPGFIDSPMTAHIEKKGALWATPEKVADDIVNAIEKGRSSIYTPWFWRYIMLIICSIPEFIFKRLSL